MDEMMKKIMGALERLEQGQTELRNKIDGIDSKIEWAVAELKSDNEATVDRSRYTHQTRRATKSATIWTRGRSVCSTSSIGSVNIKAEE